MRLIFIILFLFISCEGKIKDNLEFDIYSVVYNDKTDHFPSNARNIDGEYKVDLIKRSYAVNSKPLEISLESKKKIKRFLESEYETIVYNTDTFSTFFENEIIINQKKITLNQKKELNVVGVISFSKIYKSKDNTKAALIMNSYRSRLDASSVLYFLKLEKGSWSIIQKETINFS